ncbi:MAG TPA: hypothetical protein VE338_03615 [Ktedonobacterales bacterium]|nr:hypothetical protein [Ktedonobacterales bacterium]
MRLATPAEPLVGSRAGDSARLAVGMIASALFHSANALADVRMVLHTRGE